MGLSTAPGPDGTARADDDRRPATAAERARRRARIDAVFGDSEPSTTRDEANESGDRHSDSWWSEQRPPHHG